MVRIPDRIIPEPSFGVVLCPLSVTDNELAERFKACMRYLRVRWRSVLDVELQSLQDLPFLDKVCGVQSHILVEDLKVLTHSKRQHR